MINNQRNFSAGPGALPECVLQMVQEAIQALPETGISVLGMSHRSDWFMQLLQKTQRHLRILLGIPNDYQVLFLQGGSSLQFSMIPMAFLRGTGKTAEYLETGYWSAKAPLEAAHEGRVRIAWSDKAAGYRSLPDWGQLQLDPNAAYLHYVSNETVEGLEFGSEPIGLGVPIVCDMSSNLLSRPVDVSHFDLIYAHAQKNLGPAGVTLVIIKDEFLALARKDVPSMLNYHTHMRAQSVYNTPCVFSIYVLHLVTQWMLGKVGGVKAMGEINTQKASLIYQALAQFPAHYRIHAQAPFRSQMNVAFHLQSPAREKDFLAKAQSSGFHGLEGHRSLGGIRISLYNAIGVEATQALAEFLIEDASC